MSDVKRVLYWGMTENIGGIESFVYNVCKNINHKKIQIDFLLNHDQPKMAFEDEIKSLGGKIYRVMYSERESLVKSRTELDKFFKEHREFSAIHIHSNFLYAFPLKYAKKYNIPLRIIHSHNSGDDEYKNNCLKRIYNGVRNNRVKKQIDRYPNCYVACSDKAANYMFPNKDYVWIKNGIDIEKFKFNLYKRQRIRSELNASDDTKIIGFIGRLRNQKNLFYLIDIFKEYFTINSNSKLVIAGIGELEKELKDYSKKLVQDKKIIFLGKREDADSLYQAFDCFLLPSFYEGLPVVLVEAQTAGLSCFVADNITQQVNISSLMNYISIYNPPKYWAEVIDAKMNDQLDRSSYAGVVREAGFDEKLVASELEKIYMEY